MGGGSALPDAHGCVESSMRDIKRFGILKEAASRAASVGTHIACSTEVLRADTSV